jgi:hypothetical protein
MFYPLLFTTRLGIINNKVGKLKNLKIKKEKNKNGKKGKSKI